MHEGEAGVDAALAARLVAGQFPRWARLPVRRVPSAGTVNALFRVGDDLVARLPLVEWGEPDIERELELLPRLAPLLPTPIPVPVARGRPGEGYPWAWSLLQWLPGENPLPGSVGPDFARDLAALIKALRDVSPQGAPPSHRRSLAPRDAPFRDALVRARGLVNAAEVTAAWEDALAAPEHAGPPTWVHADLLPGNLLARKGRLAAVIDWAAGGIGDPAVDLIPAWSLLAGESREAFRDALAPGEAEWERGRGWALSIGIIALPYYLESNPAFASLARHMVEQVLAERAA